MVKNEGRRAHRRGVRSREAPGVFRADSRKPGWSFLTWGGLQKLALGKGYGLLAAFAAATAMAMIRIAPRAVNT